MNQADAGHDDSGYLLDHVLSGHEFLRESLARELQNELGSVLAGMAVDLSGLDHSTPGMNADAQAAVESSRSLLREAVVIKRQFIERLYPSTLHLLGLGVALETLARHVAESCGLDVEVTVAEIESPLPGSVEIDLYRVAEAALDNVVRHAAAQTVELVLTRPGKYLLLVIRDDGVGFELHDLDRCTGFRLMQHRLHRCHGELTLASAAGRGATLTARVPVPIAPH